MPARNYSIKVMVQFTDASVPVQMSRVLHLQDGSNSPMVNGSLALKANRFVLRHQIWDFIKPGSMSATSACNSHGSILYDDFIRDEIYQSVARLKNETYAKLRGKLYKGNAALGVTLGSYKQSRDMIRDRYQSLNHSADQVLASAATGISPKKLANLHLETIFGWKPLLQDIVASSTSVVQKAIPPEFVKSRSRAVIQKEQNSTWWHGPYQRSFTVNCMVTRSAQVRISNPNLWLAERAGLLNVGSVAWDLVPWSFVVNMFVNTGALVNSITDFWGLEFTEFSTTTTLRGTMLASAEYTHSPVGEDYSAILRSSEREKVRSVDAISRPSLQFQLPDASWDTVAIAASLFTQKVGKIGTALGFPKNWPGRH